LLVAARHDGADRHVAVPGGLPGELEGPAHQALVGFSEGLAHHDPVSAATAALASRNFVTGPVFMSRPAPPNAILSNASGQGTMRKLIATTALAVIAMAASAPPSAGAATEPSYVPGQLLVRFQGSGERV